MCHTFSTLLFPKGNFQFYAHHQWERGDCWLNPTLISPVFTRNICYKFFMAFHYHCCVFISPLFCQWHSGKSARNYKRRKFLILNIRALNYPQGLTDDCFESKNLFIFSWLTLHSLTLWDLYQCCFLPRRENIASFSVRETEVKH